VVGYTEVVDVRDGDGDVGNKRKTHLQGKKGKEGERRIPLSSLLLGP
jgi:hypothetical protein